MSIDQLKSEGQRNDSLKNIIRDGIDSNDNFPVSEKLKIDKEVSQASIEENWEREKTTLEMKTHLVDHQESIVSSISPEYQDQANFARNNPDWYAKRYVEEQNKKYQERLQLEERNQMAMAA